MNLDGSPLAADLDANVLFPFRTRDVLFTFAQEGLFRARFTDDILEEWTRNLIRLKPQLETSIRRQEQAIREHFEDCLVEGYRPLIAGLDLPDPGDRHVLAAAIRCSAQVIVTENHRDFPGATLAAYDLETLGADEMLASICGQFRQAGARALRRVRQRYRQPPMTPPEFLLDLTRNGLTNLSAVARQDVEYL